MYIECGGGGGGWGGGGWGGGGGGGVGWGVGGWGGWGGGVGGGVCVCVCVGGGGGGGDGVDKGVRCLFGLQPQSTHLLIMEMYCKKQPFIVNVGEHVHLKIVKPSNLIKGQQ